MASDDKKCEKRYEDRMFEKAQKVPFTEWKGLRFWFNDEVYWDVEEFIDCVHSTFPGEDPFLPRNVWASKDHNPRINPDDVIERFMDGLPEEFEPSGKAELIAAIEKFNKQNEGRLFDPDYSVALMLPEIRCSEASSVLE